MKCDDSFAVYACSSCHDQIDFRAGVMDEGTRSKYILDALEETQSKLFDAGLIAVKGQK